MLAACTAASLIGAALLFWVQPLVAKLLLPLLGGSPAVWNTCMVFFQVALLAGYLYAHAGARCFGPRAQATLHAGLLALAALSLPVALSPGLQPPTENWRLIPWLFGTMATTVGLPFVVVAGTAPMVQRWFAASGHPRASDPYFLYAASNIGSFAALLGFPLLLEPTLTLAEQGRAWTAGYALLAVFMLSCAAMLPARAGARRTVSAAPTSPRERLWWIALAFVPSSLMLGLTTHVTTDLAAVPLFWIVPLALYLLTFVVAFARSSRRLVRWATAAQPWPLVVVGLAPLSDYLDDWRLLLPLHLVAFTLAAIMCHGRLAEMRPPAARLTSFYLWIAFGGALGGMFNALAAPLLFPNVEEYPLMLAAACLLRPGIWPNARAKWALAADVLVPVAVVAAFYWPDKVFAVFGLDWRTISEAWAFLLIAVLASILWFGRRRPLRLALAIGALLLLDLTDWGLHDIVYRERTFFGTLKVEEDRDEGLRYLEHGTTFHGAEFMDRDRHLRLVGYYHPQGPIGQVLRLIGGTARTAEVAVVGLGTGTLACYGHAGERWRFYEIDPAVERIARSRYFDYLAECPPDKQVILGDARLSLSREPDRRFGTIILDAFTSDAIPVHLLTREALALYLDKLAPDGLLLIHISNRYFDLTGPLARAAASLGVAAVHRDDDDEIEKGDYKSASHWVIFARKPEALAFLQGDPRWQPLPPVPGRPWTDDFSNVIEALDP